MTDLEFEDVDGGVAGEGEDAVGFPDGDGKVGGMDAGVEVVGFCLKSIFVCALREEEALVAAAGSCEGDVEGGEEENGEVGLEVVAEGGVQGKDAGGGELASGSLIGLRRVGEAVAEDDGAGGKGGADDLGDRLGAVGEHEGKLGERGDGADGGFGAGVEEEAADAFAEGGRAGVAERDDAAALRDKVGGEAAELGGFAGAVESLEGDEEPTGHDGSFALERRWHLTS